MRGLIFGFLILGIIFAGCISEPAAPEENATEPAEIPNPAAEYCDKKDYGYEIKTNAAGEYGVCKYNGKQCEEWALYRAECCLTDDDCRCDAGLTKTCHENQTCSCVSPVEEPEEVPEEIPEEEPEEEEETGPEYSDKTVGQFLEDGIAKLNSEFYKAHPSGNFTVETYTWIIGNVDIKPDQIPVGAADLESSVLFNNEKNNKLRGFGFKAYVPAEGGFSEARAIAVFNAGNTMLDVYQSAGIDIKIDFYPFSKSLHYCTITGKEQYLAEDESWITNYYFSCEDSGPLIT